MAYLLTIVWRGIAFWGTTTHYTSSIPDTDWRDKEIRPHPSMTCHPKTEPVAAIGSTPYWSPIRR